MKRIRDAANALVDTGQERRMRCYEGLGGIFSPALRKPSMN
jgi:hypothetical protein